MSWYTKHHLSLQTVLPVESYLMSGGKGLKNLRKVSGTDTMDTQLEPGSLWQLAPSGALCFPTLW